MPQQVDNATIMMIDCICKKDIGRKLRVAGRCGFDYICSTLYCRVELHRMLTYDAETALVLLHDASNAVLVDVSLCVDADVVLSAPKVERKDRDVKHRWAIERKGYVWVVGYVERVDVSDGGSRYALSISHPVCICQTAGIAYTHASSLPTAT